MTGDPTASPAGPVTEHERLITLDFVRGVAQPMIAYAWPPAIGGGMTAGDQAVWLFQFGFVDAKFRGLFTVLFGAGMYLFSERGEARGADGGLPMRRLLI